MTDGPVVFSRPYRAPHETRYLEQVLASGHLHGDGVMTELSTRALLTLTGAPAGLLTTSCTHALELAGILLDLGPDDEVVVPSFTFSSTASAVAARGATPVFVDVTPDTLNVDPSQVAAAITPRTAAIYVLHYGGVGADMVSLQAIAAEHGLPIVEDNAHGLGARRDGHALGTIGALGAQSFHDTKNVSCGEGGALLLNDLRLAERAEIVREKGTDRARFLRGQVDRYTWVDVGSSYLPSELLAAVLLSQLEAFDDIQAARHRVWGTYASELSSWAADQSARLMQVPPGAEHPAHVFYVLTPSHDDQTALLAHLRARGVIGTFHYQPLHSSPAGRRLGRTPSGCPVAEDVAGRLVRLPLWPSMTPADVERVLEATASYRALAPSAAPQAGS